MVCSIGVAPVLENMGMETGREQRIRGDLALEYHAY